MLIVTQAEFDRIIANEQTMVLQLGERPCTADCGPQPIRVGFRGPSGHVRVPSVMQKPMGQLTEDDARRLCAPSLAVYRAAWNQRHPVYDRWHATRLVWAVRVWNDGVPEEYRQRDVFELLKEQGV